MRRWVRGFGKHDDRVNERGGEELRCGAGNLDNLPACGDDADLIKKFMGRIGIEKIDPLL